jgi:hypothetical protein
MNPKRIGQLIIIALVLTAGYFFYAQVFGATTVGKTLTPAGSLQTGLVGHWTFDGKDMLSNVADISGNGNNGTLVGFTSTTTVSGKVGQALEFDGSGAHVLVTVGSGSVLNISGAVTVTGWVYLGPSTDTYPGFFGRGKVTGATADRGPYKLGYNNTTTIGQVRWALGDGVTSSVVLSNALLV